MHTGEKKLQRFALDPGRFSEKEKTEIEAHLRECKWCSEAYEQLVEMYANFAEEHAEEAQVHGPPKLENHLPILHTAHEESL